MGSDFRSRMAQLAQEDAAGEYGRLVDLVKAIFAMNQLLRYGREEKLGDDPFEILSLLANPPAMFEADFKATLKEIVRLNDEDEEPSRRRLEAILDAGLPCLRHAGRACHPARPAKAPRDYLVQMIDKLFQKNGPFGAVAPGVSRAPTHGAGTSVERTLEVFAQLAVLQHHEAHGREAFLHRADGLIEDFACAGWSTSYGFVIAPATTPEGRRPVTLDEHRAFRDNARALKDRLREIGFYDDVSDAYNAQTVRPRYTLSKQGFRDGYARDPPAHRARRPVSVLDRAPAPATPRGSVGSRRARAEDARSPRSRRR